MSIKHYCDGCKAEITSTNRFIKFEKLLHTFPETEVDFEFHFSYASNANGPRILANDGDLCRACFWEVIRQELALLEEAELDAHLGAQEDELAAEEEEEADEDVDEDDATCSDGEDDFPNADPEDESETE